MHGTFVKLTVPFTLTPYHLNDEMARVLRGFLVVGLSEPRVFSLEAYSCWAMGSTSLSQKNSVISAGQNWVSMHYIREDDLILAPLDRKQFTSCFENDLLWSSQCWDLYYRHYFLG